MQSWRWDQGRILYFQYDVLKEIARVLVKYDGMDVNDDETAARLKDSLVHNTGLPFLPANYKIIKNYSRVFQCAMLAATRGKGILTVTGICRQLAQEHTIFVSADSYLMEIVNRFRYPFPAFKEYNNVDTRVYPFCAVLKYLIAKELQGKEASVSLEEICNYIIGNSCTGLEDISYYNKLGKTSHEVTGDGLRQLREMTVFIGQLSFIKIFDRRIYLDVENEEEALSILNNMIRPIENDAMQDRLDEFLSLTHLKHTIITQTTAQGRCSNPQETNGAVNFMEGKRKRAYHLRIERSPLLRKHFILLHPEPICDACKMHMKTKYPWVDYMLDLHHLLPLSSAIRITVTGTSLSDIVGLCPSCHRAIHSYYSKWLKANNREDFYTKKEAMEVYLDALREIA